MNKTPSRVLSFLTDLQQKLTPLGIDEREKFVQLKREEFKEKGWKWDEKKDAVLKLWDYRYYERLSLEKELDLGDFTSFTLIRRSVPMTDKLKRIVTDDNLLQEYFPVSKVVPSVLDLYKDLLEIELVKVPQEHGETYHSGTPSPISPSLFTRC